MRISTDRRSDFGVSFPDFPGGITAGRTLDEARKMAVEALSLHMTGMIEDGEPIPEPCGLDSLANDPTLKGGVAFLVSVDTAEKAVRFNITARRSQMEEIDRRARRQGMTRSAYIVASALGEAAAERSGRASR
ncbi:MAG TPA: type II toxin-antitoxin system HicB family antitoxin [Blastocatellia bacterium]|nr:type II toxin-antitoxin system HicB family antitoxin [Blastocatellia bacterium]